MGKAPDVKEALVKTREQEWVLDPATGQIVPEVPRGRPGYKERCWCCGRAVRVRQAAWMRR